MSLEFQCGSSTSNSIMFGKLLIMHVKTFQVRSDNPSNDLVLNLFNHPHQWLHYIYLNGRVICCSFMPVNKKTVLNENRVRVNVRWTAKTGNQI